MLGDPARQGLLPFVTRDPFAFMGIRRGADRPDDPPARRSPQPSLVIPNDQRFTEAVHLLHELNAWTTSLTGEVVANIASRYGFECDAPWPGVFTLRYGRREVAAFLVQGAPSALSHAPVFELFIGVDGTRVVA